jgi:hypothetical protein
MLELKEIVLKSEGTKEIWRKDTNSIEWKNANKLNFLLTGIGLNKRAKCECIEDLFIMLKFTNINNKIMSETNRQFHLHKGKVVTSFQCDTITEHSSDEQMIAALKAVPALIKFFKRVPDNWREICDLSEIKNAVKDKVEDIEDFLTIEDLKVPELIAILKSKGVEYPKNPKKNLLITLVKLNS